MFLAKSGMMHDGQMLIHRFFTLFERDRLIPAHVWEKPEEIQIGVPYTLRCKHCDVTVTHVAINPFITKTGMAFPFVCERKYET